MAIFLRPVTLQDGPNIISWRNNEVVRDHCMSKDHITEKSNKQFFLDYVETGKYKQFIVQYIDENYPVYTYPIATVYLKDIDYGNKRCELCVFTSHDKEWKAEQITESIKLLLSKAFKEYDMHKVYSYVFAKFPNEIDILEKAGFIQESLLKEEALNAQGKYEDIVRMSIFNFL